MLNEDITKELLKDIDETIILLDQNNQVIYQNKDYSPFEEYIFNDKQGEYKLSESNKWIKVNKRKIYDITVVEIKDISLYNCLLDKSTKDELTGLLNRLGMRIRLDNIINNEETRNICFVMCDIDYFKNINDAYGHDAGDEVLIIISSILRTIDSEKTSIIRYGGEEFLIIFQNKTINDVLNKIESIRKQIEEKMIYFDEQYINVTMSFGIYCHSSKDIDITSAIKKADIALYESKDKGRNMISVYDECQKK